MTTFLLLALTFYNPQARVEWEGAWSHSDAIASSRQGVVSALLDQGPPSVIFVSQSSAHHVNRTENATFE